MNTLPQTEDEGCFLLKKVQDFTEDEKQEAINIFHTMVFYLEQERQTDLAQEYTLVATRLQPMNSSAALIFLSSFLEFEKINTITNIKSFICLKKLSQSNLETNTIMEKRLAKRVALEMLHLIFYKTLPCPEGNLCKFIPRKIVNKNDFLDEELNCCYYHHEKDRRRFVLNGREKTQKEFKYAGNFFDGKSNDKSAFSHNFFESLYHPLYYKNFRCVRTECSQSVLCPYNHSAEEKIISSLIFKNFFGKEKEIFTKKRNSEEEKNSRFFHKRSSANGSKLGRLSLLSTGSMK